MEISADLHGHTLFSDGRATPEDYVAVRRARGVKVLAVTDHDVMEGVLPAVAAAASKGAAAMVIPAVEVTSFINPTSPAREQFHVLAYFPHAYTDPARLQTTELFARSRRALARWKEFAVAWLERLPAEDRDVLDPDRGLMVLPPVRFPSIQGMFDLMTERGAPGRLLEDLDGRFVEFWDGTRELFGWSPEEAVECIRADGATDVVAHPGFYRDQARTERMIAHCRGLEAYSPYHAPEACVRYRAMAEAQRKLWTAATDDHKNDHYAPPPVRVPKVVLERLLRQPIPLHVALGG